MLRGGKRLPGDVGEGVVVVVDVDVDVEYFEETESFLLKKRCARLLKDLGWLPVVVFGIWVGSWW